MNRLIYLYLKESPLGLKYLGKTIKEPFKYSGSGIRWLNHLKSHKIKTCELKTTILFSSYKIEEIKEKGLYYSELWNIVNSKEFANLTPESGEGTWGYKYSEETLKKMRGRKVSKETREKLRLANLGKPNKKAALKNSKKVINKQTGEVFNSIQEAAKSVSIPRGTLYTQLLYGYRSKFKYVNPLSIKQKEDNLRIKVMNKETKDIYDSITEAARSANMKPHTLGDQLKYKVKNCKFEYYGK